MLLQFVNLCFKIGHALSHFIAGAAGRPLLFQTLDFFAKLLQSEEHYVNGCHILLVENKSLEQLVIGEDCFVGEHRCKTTPHHSWNE